ncbi:hypothetical protein [uncultured Gilvimarinus sp.]|uniref:phage tail assembly protein T n=1 Tax=uncultured Gilvimarinus sp. TaxID=1689143 RepID=UPI0030D9E977
MPQDEIDLWLAYRRKHGPLTDGARIDRGFALLAHLVSSACGDKQSSIEKFMPKYAPEPESDPDKVGSLDDVLQILGVKA